MKRKEFLHNLTLIGVGTTMLKPNLLGSQMTSPPGGVCTLIPSETAGPFPLDLTENNKFLRQDIRDGKPGVQLNVKLKVLGLGNCLPMQNVRVNIWHCDKDGIYSGYNNNQNQGDLNAINHRGYQFTNANGEVDFITIFPGWYNGRIAHIHFQVAVSTSYAAVSQLTWEIAPKNALYAANATLYTKGADPMTLAADNIFSNGYALQIATLTPNTTTGGYDTYMEISVQGNGTTGIGHIEAETAKVVELGQNFPNPFNGRTTIPFTLKYGANVQLQIWSLDGKIVGTLDQGKLSVGNHSIDVDLNKMDLTNASYIYQLEIKNDKGIFRIPKMMTFMD